MFIVSQSEFAENVCKYSANQTIFDKDLLNWSKWTIWVNPYCLWLLIARQYFKVEKKCFQRTICFKSYIVSWFELVRDFFKQYVYTSNHTCFCYKFIKFILIRRDASNHIRIESKFFKNLWYKTQVRTYKKLIKTWKKQFGSSHIVPDKTLATIFEAIDGNLYIILVRTARVKPYCPLIRMF